MKTTILNQKCAELNLFTFGNIPTQWTKPQKLGDSTFDYSEKVNNNYTLPSEILYKYEHGLFWDCRKQLKNNSNEVELYYIERSQILFLSPKGNLVRLISYKGKYSFSPDYSHFREVERVSHYKRKDIYEKSGLKEPNNIGVFTEKKINEWLEYCDNLIDLNKSIVEGANDKNKQIEQQIENFINSVKCNVQKWSNNTDVVTEHFRVTFTHDKQSQYLSKKIEFKGTLEDIQRIEK